MTPPRWQRHRARSIPGETWLNLKVELLAFPTGKHDDQVALDKWAPGGVPNLEPGFFRPPRDYVEPYRRDDPLLSLKVL
jgi:hypothetical protein